MTKKEIKKLDNKWSLLVKKEASYRCEVCGKEAPLNSHHFIGRTHRSLRWVVQNGFCLCVGCHKFNRRSAHEDPQWFVEYAKLARGESWYNKIKIQKRRINKFSYKDNLEMMDMYLEEIEKKYQNLDLLT